jgi:hypothetical protein
MHDLPADHFDRVERYRWGDSASVSRVLDHIIELAAAELEWRGAENANSLRDFWYNPTKPIVERVFPEKDRLDDRLSERLSEAVEDGRVRYRDLNILDDSRKRRLYTTSPESDRILFVEKRSAYRKLQPLAEVYELTLISGGGHASTAMIEDVIHHLQHGGGGASGYEVFLLSDYDPSGFCITESFVERCRVLGLPIKSVERVGISPDHLEDEEIARQRFEPPVDNDRAAAWLEENGIEGRYGLELEAVGDREKKGEALRRLVVGEIGDQIRVDERRDRDLQHATEEIAPRAARDIADSLVDDIRTRLREEADDLLAARYDLRPDAYDTEGLHEGAIEGGSPQISITSETAAVKEELRDRIDSGEIPIDDLLGEGGDRT